MIVACAMLSCFTLGLAAGGWLRAAEFERTEKALRVKHAQLQSLLDLYKRARP